MELLGLLPPTTVDGTVLMLLIFAKLELILDILDYVSAVFYLSVFLSIVADLCPRLLLRVFATYFPLKRRPSGTFYF